MLNPFKIKKKMKKILLYLLLACSISTFAQAEFPEGIQLGGNTSTANSTKLLNQNPTTGTLDHINATSLPISTAVANALAAKQNTLVSGTNIKTINGNSILGSGDIVVGGGLTPDLQTVLDTGKSFSYDSGFSAGEISGGTAFDRYTYFQHQNNETGALIEQGGLLVRNNYVYLQNIHQDKNSAYVINQGQISIEYANNTSGGTTQVKFEDPTVSSSIKFPAKTVAGTYTINTTPNIIYTVSTLPTGVLNDMAIVSDATAPTYLGVLVGGGAVVTPVWYNGTNWVAH